MALYESQLETPTLTRLKTPLRLAQIEGDQAHSHLEDAECATFTVDTYLHGAKVSIKLWRTMHHLML